jgi:hypothetical protein
MLILITGGEYEDFYNLSSLKYENKNCKQIFLFSTLA